MAGEELKRIRFGRAETNFYRIGSRFIYSEPDVYKPVSFMYLLKEFCKYIRDNAEDVLSK